MVWRIDDRVLTPSGEEARVRGIQGDFLMLQYSNPIIGREAQFQLHQRLCRLFVPGFKQPAPAVIGDPVEVAVRRVTMKRSRW